MYKIIMPVLMGLEAVVRDELEELGFKPENISLDNGQVTLIPEQTQLGLSRTIALLNIHLACAERVELEIAEFSAEDFDELFDEVQMLDWATWIPKNAAFTVKRGYSGRSKLFAPPAIQSTIKKGIVVALQKAWGLSEKVTISEDKDFLELEITYYFQDDVARLTIDTSGQGLHRRGYRTANNEAPISETLAAGIIRLSQFAPFTGELFYDPCCGSGTFPIEAAMFAAEVKPGARRTFTAEKWSFLDITWFDKVREEALANENIDIDECFIAGSDIDAQSIAFSRINAEQAGVANLIDFSVIDLKKLDAEALKEKYEQERLLIVANPPYGERISSSAKAKALDKAIGELAFYPRSKFTRPGVRLSVITARDFEEDTNQGADKRRKLYNGMIQCTMFHYFREKYL